MSWRSWPPHPEFDPADLAAELTSGLDVYAGGDQTLDVRTVFSWSYRGLNPTAAQLFRLLGLHPGPDIGTAAATGLAGAEARGLLRELGDAHLLTELRPGRFTCHDLLRAYAAELVAAAEDTAEARRSGIHRMLDHYLRTADQAAHLLDPYRTVLELPEPAPGSAPEDLPDTDGALTWFSTEHRVLQEFTLLSARWLVLLRSATIRGVVGVGDRVDLCSGPLLSRRVRYGLA